jgi:hypothetical protein
VRVTFARFLSDSAALFSNPSTLATFLLSTPTKTRSLARTRARTLNPISTPDSLLLLNSSKAMQSSSAASSSGALLNAASPAVLLLALVVSATTLMVRLPKHGKISLPTYQTESEAVNAVSSHQTTSPSDPFDLYDADIWTDGVSLDDGEQFWKSMTLIKGPLAILVGLLLATRLVALVLPVIQGSPLPAGFLFSAGISGKSCLFPFLVSVRSLLTLGLLP